jgi:hypothetical protein
MAPPKSTGKLPIILTDTHHLNTFLALNIFHLKIFTIRARVLAAIKGDAVETKQTEGLFQYTWSFSFDLQIILKKHEMSYSKPSTTYRHKEIIKMAHKWLINGPNGITYGL